MENIADYKYALDKSAIVAITDQKGIILYLNNNFCEISKYRPEELIGQEHRIINSSHHPNEFIRDLWITIANGRMWKGELKNKAKDGSVYWVDTTIKSSDHKPFIKMKTEISGDSILFSVADNGLGIDLVRHKDKIFKIRKTFHRQAEAKGFGLFMTKTQVEAMGGKIWAESQPQIGSTFFC